MSIIYQNGLGDTLGDALATCKPLYTSGTVWYVGLGGTDGASPAGQNREKPLATLAQAYTNAASGDIIEFLSGYSATFVASLTINKSLTLVGGGAANGLPTVKLTTNMANPLFSITTAEVELRNLWFTPNLVASTAPRITTSGPYFRMSGCYVECGANDNAAGVSIGAGSDASRIAGTTFVSVATASAAQPESGLKVTAGLTLLELDSVVFNGGAFGFSNYRAMDASGFAVTGLRATNISQLLGADVKLNAGTSGYWNTQLATGGARLDW